MYNRNNINIKGNNQVFPYLIEYIIDDKSTNGSDISWYIDNKDKECVRLLNDNIKYYRYKNDWYKRETENINNQYIPELVNTSKIKVYLPSHSISAYKRGVKYVLSIHTYINGYKIDFGSFIFKPTDSIANEFGKIKYGGVEYNEYVEFTIIDPRSIVYSDDWKLFRENVCKEPDGINNTGSMFWISLYPVKEYDNRHLLESDYIGGITSFDITKSEEFLSLNLSYSEGSNLNLTINYNKEYNWFLDYLKETYNINCSQNDIKFEIIIKNKDTIAAVAKIPYNAVEDFGKINQLISYNSIIHNESFKEFFSSWENFSEGWNFVSSLIVYNDAEEEIFNVVSNELPITQDIFSRFINGGSKKIINLNDMEVKDYKVVNKIVNEIIQVERPNDSRSNIMQPVFFRVKETELLTLHPMVTENICINLDDYKSKVNTFTLMINNVKFKQIGANNYGIIFKVVGNKISSETNSGIYYILDDNMELVTSGKYNCVI